MNPVLLKPQSGNGAQIVVRGRVIGQARAREYQDLKPKLLPAVLDSFATTLRGGRSGPCRRRRERVGNQSARERHRQYGLCPRRRCSGGFGRRHRSRRRHRPDRRDQDGARSGRRGNDRGFSRQQISRRSRSLCERHAKDRGIDRLAGLGLIPFCAAAARLPEEDSHGLAAGKSLAARAGSRSPFRSCPASPISTISILSRSKARSVSSWCRSGETLPVEAALVILPGSKTTIADLAAFRREGWDIDLFAHLRRGGHVLGLCGGYQMLGKVIRDPTGIEGPPGEAQGLGLLDIETELLGDKVLAPVHGKSAQDGAPFTGYEMHIGRTFGPDCARPLLHFADGRSDGAVSANGRVSGCYVHGLFTDAAQRSALLARLGGKGSGVSYDETARGGARRRRRPSRGAYRPRPASHACEIRSAVSASAAQWTPQAHR